MTIEIPDSVLDDLRERRDQALAALHKHTDEQHEWDDGYRPRKDRTARKIRDDMVRSQSAYISYKIAVAQIEDPPKT